MSSVCQDDLQSRNKSNKSLSWKLKLLQILWKVGAQNHQKVSLIKEGAKQIKRNKITFKGYHLFPSIFGKEGLSFILFLKMSQEHLFNDFDFLNNI